MLVGIRAGFKNNHRAGNKQRRTSIIVRPFCKGASAFATKLDDDLRKYLDRSGVEWRLLEEPAQFDAEGEWRSIFGEAFRGQGHFRTGSKAEFEYLRQACSHYLIIPFTSRVKATSVQACRKAISTYECRGGLVPLGRFCDAEFFISPLDFEWTMVHTHEDHAGDGP